MTLDKKTIEKICIIIHDELKILTVLESGVINRLIDNLKIRLKKNLVITEDKKMIKK